MGGREKRIDMSDQPLDGLHLRLSSNNEQTNTQKGIDIILRNDSNPPGFLPPKIQSKPKVRKKSWKKIH